MNSCLAGDLGPSRDLRHALRIETSIEIDSEITNYYNNIIENDKGKRNDAKPAASSEPLGEEMGNQADIANKKRGFFYRLDEMNVEALAPEMTTSAGALVEGDKIYVGLVHKARGSGSQPHRHPFEQ